MAIEQWTVISLSKADSSAIISNELEKKKIRLEKQEFKKLLAWDKIAFGEGGKISVIYRSKPLSVSKCSKLMKHSDPNKKMEIKILGTLSEDGKSLTEGTASIEIATPLFLSSMRGAEIIIENATLHNSKLFLLQNARILSKSNGKKSQTSGI